jgi:hypothetical protein
MQDPNVDPTPPELVERREERNVATGRTSPRADGRLDQHRLQVRRCDPDAHLGLGDRLLNQLLVVVGVAKEPRSNGPRP